MDIMKEEEDRYDYQDNYEEDYEEEYQYTLTMDDEPHILKRKY